MFFKAFDNNAFNNNKDCVAGVDDLLKQYSGSLTDSNKIDLLRLQGDSYFKLYQYTKAHHCDSILLKQYSSALKKDKLDDIKNELTMRAALVGIPPQQVIITNSTSVPWHRDKIGLVEFPLKTNKKPFDGIFDTRANISTITTTYAQKLGLHILNVSYNEGSGATGIQFKTGMGIADSLRIGNVVVKNVVFQVMPDSILYIAPIKFQLNVIIGYPVIEQLQQVNIYRDGRMTIPASPEPGDLHNFALNGLDPILALKTGTDTLAFNFDSGASSSVLYKAYFDRYKTSIIKSAVKKTVGFGGAGGAQKKEVYVLPKLSLALGDRSTTIDSVSILTEKITPGEKLYGNIGQDLTKQFNEVIYNFKYMYIKGI
ncbi:MAG TPA: retropepsin-like aspartic protease [Mucilaginibacter sp.]|nr:retropepsin-like aspartic protease [Mucilaginibacter sp.]